MPLDEIQIEETENGVVAHLFPTSYVEIEKEKEPTKKVDENGQPILVDVGKLGGKNVPVNIYYPDTYSLDRVLGAIDVLQEKKEDCPVCARNAAMVRKKFEDIRAAGGTDEEQADKVYKLLEELRQEVAHLRGEDVEPTPTGPPSRLAKEHHFLGPEHDWLLEKEARTLSAVRNAHESFLEMIKQILIPPRIPTFGEAIYMARNGRGVPVEKGVEIDV